MFEKEAESYATQFSFYKQVFAKKNFLVGAEFGYNKANDKIEALEERCEIANDEIIRLQKINEWQYPSKGEYPECDENTLLMIYVTCYYEVGGSSVTRNRTVLGYYQKSFMNDDVKVFVEKSKGYSCEHLPKDVIAWKEIVLPKENE